MESVVRTISSLLAMPTRYGRKLACEVVLEHFGESVENVFKVLVYRGQQPLADIGRQAKLSPSQLKNCLLVLTQHNCVQAFRTEADPNQPLSRSQTQYVALVDITLQRLRFPKFMMHIRETLGQETEALLQGLLEHGRLSVEQLLQRAMAHASNSEAELGRAVKRALSSLVRGQYVERCPVPEPIVGARLISDVIKKGLRGGSRNKGSLEAEGYFNSEVDRILLAAQSPEADRFRLPPSVIAVDDMDPSDGIEEPSSNGQVGGKRKRNDSPLVDSSVEVKDVLWRVNHEEFLRHFRHEACVTQITERFDGPSGIVVGAILKHTRLQESSVRQPSSASMSLEAISQAVRSNPEGYSIGMDRVRLALNQLSSDSTAPVQRSTDGGSQFFVNMKKIIEVVKGREIEAVMSQRYGAAGCRIFRLLLMKRQLEQKQIGEMAMIPLKDSREILYKMLKDDYVTLQEVAKTAEHAPSRTFYLWRVSLPGVKRNLLDHMCHAASNLRQRLKHEMEKEQEVLTLLEPRPTSGGGVAPAIQLTIAQRQQLERIRRVAAVLETSLLRLDHAIMLFSCF